MNYILIMETIIERKLNQNEFVVIFESETNRQLYYPTCPYKTITEGANGTCYIIAKNDTCTIVDFQDLQDKWLEIEPELTKTEKLTKLKLIRKQLLEKTNWINTAWAAQELGNNLGISTEPKIISDALMSEWLLWFEQIVHIPKNWTDVYLEGLNIEDIDENLFPVCPEYPDDIM